MTNVAALDNSKTNEEGLYKFLNRVFGPGVATVLNPSSMQVVQRGAGANMSVDVSTGDVLLERPTQDLSLWGWEPTTANNVTITTADPTNPRIDAIVAWIDVSVTSTSLNNSPGALKFSAIAGTPAGSPSAPTNSAIQTALGSTVAWTRLANVTVGAGVSSIVNANISDQRTPVSLRIPQIIDSSGNKVATLSKTASAVNYLDIANAATSNGPTLSAAGSDTNIDINFTPKGTGQVKGIVNHLYNPYKASANRTTTQSIPNTTWTKVQVNNKLYDTSNNYDNATNYRFTAPVAGFYFARLTGTMAGALMQTSVDLYVNGSSYKGSTLSPIVQDNRQNTTNTPQWVDIVQLNANDYLEMFIWHNFGSAASLTYAAITYALMWTT